MSMKSTQKQRSHGARSSRRPSKSLPDWLLEQAGSIRQATRAICYRFANDPENDWTARQLVELLGDAL